MYITEGQEIFKEGIPTGRGVWRFTDTLKKRQPIKSWGSASAPSVSGRNSGPRKKDLGGRGKEDRKGKHLKRGGEGQ